MPKLNVVSDTAPNTEIAAAKAYYDRCHAVTVDWDSKLNAIASEIQRHRGAQNKAAATQRAHALSASLGDADALAAIKQSDADVAEANRMLPIAEAALSQAQAARAKALATEQAALGQLATVQSAPVVARHVAAAKAIDDCLEQIVGHLADMDSATSELLGMGNPNAYLAMGSRFVNMTFYRALPPRLRAAFDLSDMDRIAVTRPAAASAAEIWASPARRG